jgi:choline dehydrogenase
MLLQTDLRKTPTFLCLFWKRGRKRQLNSSLGEKNDMLINDWRSPEGLINYTVPLFNYFLRQNNPRDWNYTTTVLSGLNGRVLQYPRGRLLGGCTSMSELKIG